METLIEKTPRQLFKSLFVFAAQESWIKAREIAEELTNRGAQGLWLNLAFDLADGFKKITRLSDKLFLLGNNVLIPEEITLIEEALTWVQDKLQLPIPLLIIDICPDGTPLHTVTGINGLGFIASSKSDIKNKDLMIHEITHCNLMSRSLFLDEGLATLFQYQALNDKVLKEVKYWDRPSLSALVEIEWRNDPYFSRVLPANNYNSIDHSSNSDLRVHFLAAFLIEKMIQKTSLNTLVQTFKKIKPKLREGRGAKVFQDIFSIDLWALDLEIIKSMEVAIKPPSNEATLEVATKALAENDEETANLWLPIARIKAYESNDDLIALIKILIVLGNRREKPSERAHYRTEALAAMNWLESKETNDRILDFFDAYKYLFKIRNAGHAIEIGALSAQASKVFKALLLKNPEDPEIIIASAKAQIRAKYDFISFSDWKEMLKKTKSYPQFKKAVDILKAEHSRFVE
ncbi:hypothetical protein [Aquimarina sp. RZ0]|uniref:hypothetical protein n=1 Tax=Aquimarina sp. RZ0 TaxID=2607730 RepID=UPI0011F24B68|nr:hypothetical protein [Aquimarina sp. RZ0]